jgi:elongation factor G
MLRGATGLFKRSLGRNFCLDIKKVRNIGVSAHIDSGKTTFTERILYYSGKIGSIHEVKGGDGVGATMDFMELEREKGITIQSASTTVFWRDHMINVIDTPGHVDFTIEVERALRVLDGAILLICGVGGVQAQTLTVDKQMKRYGVPRLIFINKLDRMGSNPWSAISAARDRLGLKCAAIQIPIGQDNDFVGLVDLLRMKALYFDGESGQRIREEPVPDKLKELAEEKFTELVTTLADIDPEIGDLYLEEKRPTTEQLEQAIRRQTIACTFCPVFMGAAYKNKGVQNAMDGILKFLPAPNEVKNEAFYVQPDGTEEKKEIPTDNKLPFVCLAFKLDENKFGQITFCRVYQGKLKKGDLIMNARTGEKIKVSRMGKMHANHMEDIQETEAGDIFVLFGVQCASGDTLTSPAAHGKISLSSMYVPRPVISLQINPKNKQQIEKLTKAFNKFQREDPTFHVDIDEESEEIIISGMGELHLQIYVERLKREFDVECEVGKPTVNYRETLSGKVDFNYLHKKQTGGAGQFARVIGHMVPLSHEEGEFMNQFENKVVGATIPNEYITAIERQFHDSCVKGPLTGYPVVNTKYILESGETHVVDSSSNAFAVATRSSFNYCFQQDGGVLLEPIMDVEVTVPFETYVRLV